jgi:hypothetical protein
MTNGAVISSATALVLHSDVSFFGTGWAQSELTQRNGAPEWAPCHIDFAQFTYTRSE